MGDPGWVVVTLDSFFLPLRDRRVPLQSGFYPNRRGEEGRLFESFFRPKMIARGQGREPSVTSRGDRQ